MAAMGPLEYKESGNQHFKAQRWQEAADEYTKGLNAGHGKELPRDTNGLLLSNRSQCWLNLSDWQRAFDDADACLKFLPEHSKSLFRRATALEKLGKLTDAMGDYAKVARADPKNKDAVAATQRLRDEVLTAGAQKADELLPISLVKALGEEATEGANDSTNGSTASVLEKKIDACSKIQALCVHKGLTNACVTAKAVEGLLKLVSEETTPQDLHEAALSTLLVMASGQEAADEEDGARGSPQSSERNAGPLPVPPGAAETRKRLLELMSLPDIRRACRHRAKSTARFAVIIGLVHEPETTEAMEALHDAISFTEGGEVNVARGGIVGLSSMLDMRWRLGLKGKPLMAPEVLLKCVESALNTTGCETQLGALMPRIFALLADKERPKEMEVDVGVVSMKMLDPFLASKDLSLRANGLGAFEALFAADETAATEVLHGGPAALSAILGAISNREPGPDGLRAQDHAASCLMLAGRSRRTRQSLLDGGGIEMLLKTLADGPETTKGLLRAKLVNVLAILAGHNAEVREEVFDRLDFLMELRFALDTTRDHVREQANAGKDKGKNKDEARKVFRSLYESCVCLTIHGEFKELLSGAKKTLKSMQDLVTGDDLYEDQYLAFLYSSLVYNICRSASDKIRPKKDQFPFNELQEDDLNALEEFYEKMPPESRPVKNGEVDAGSQELAEKMRMWCMLQSGTPGGTGGGGKTASSSPVVASLARCVAGGNVRAQNMAAMAFKFLAQKQEYRRVIATSGGLRALLNLVDVEDTLAKDSARQALAQVLIVTNPNLLQYKEQLDAVRPLVETLSHKHELLQFEAAMGLTNLLTANEELRTRAVQGDAWQACRDLLFQDNEMVQRAGLETMCNLCMAPEIIERFVEGKLDNDLKIFNAFALTDDIHMQVAVTGALAMIAPYEEIAPKIAAQENYKNLLQVWVEAPNADVEHRVASVLCSICAAPKGIDDDTLEETKAALKIKLIKGIRSEDAAEMVRAALEGS
eukprot:TRINITY_DN25498_c0_g1_i1.p1 TRINITY_DN25498_c0_g1~~TRINITY_DN25498_c0_g1_i1.p1  ORF type:complete len:1016 (-),score=228.00 TRINITY_DN25498_c0_g1_i1:125-3097(-)